MAFAEFWNGLNQGKIDWKWLLSEDTPIEERGEGIEALIKRGFVIIPSEKSGKRATGFFITRFNTNLSPVFEDKKLYFTKENYADDYITYLLSLDIYKLDCRRDFHIGRSEYCVPE